MALISLTNPYILLMGNELLGWLHKKTFKYYRFPARLFSGPLDLTIKRKNHKHRTFPYNPAQHKYKNPNKGTSKRNVMGIDTTSTYGGVVWFHSNLPVFGTTELLSNSAVEFNEEMRGNSSKIPDLESVSYQN